MHTRYTFALALLLALMAACKKDESCNPNEAGLYIRSEWYTHVAPGEHIPGQPADSMRDHLLYAYDADRHLQKITTTSTRDDSTSNQYFANYQFNECGQLQRIDYLYSLDYEWQTFTYNDAGQCVVIYSTVYAPPYNTPTIDSISYTDSSIIVKNYHEGYAYVRFYSEFIFDAQKQNIITSNHGSYIIHYTYDNKPNPRKKLNLPPDLRDTPYNFSANNILSIIYSDTTINIPRTYNAQGYPLTAERGKTVSYVEL